MRYRELFEIESQPKTPKELISYMLDKLKNAAKDKQDGDKLRQLMYSDRKLQADIAAIEKEETNLEFEKLRSEVEELIRQAEIDEEQREKIHQMAMRKLKQDL